MKAFLVKWWHVAGIASIYVQGLIYMWIGRYAGTASSVHVDYYWVDTKIPFLSWFSFPYASWMLVMYLGFLYFAIRNRSLFWRVFIAYNVAVLACNVIFVLMPTYVPRPDFPLTDSASMLVQFIYSHDAPFNCFPSVHCLTSYLLFITINRDMKLAKLPRIGWSVLLWLIIASTVFIKQHSLLDVAGGIALAEAAYQMVRYASRRLQVPANEQVGA
jgi:membrane-associated phospholipid phosphatase